MTRSQVSHDRRESIAFAGSRCNSVQAEPHEQQYVQGISPTPTPSLQDDQRGPAGAPLWVAGLALAAGLACSVAWRSMFGSSPDNSQRDSRYQQDSQAERAPLDSIRNLPQSVAATLSQDEEPEAPFPNSLSAIKTLPVQSNTASLEADARAIQSRLAEQRKSHDTPADAKVTDLDNASVMRQPSKTQDPQKDPSEQKPRSDTPPSSATAAETDNNIAGPDDSAQVDGVQDHDSSLPAPQSMSAEAQASSKTDLDVPEPQAATSSDSTVGSKAAAVEPASDAVASSTDTFGTASDSSIQQTGSASEASPALDAESAEEDVTQAAREELHDLISSSNDDESDIPAAFKTFDSNLPDEPEPDASQQGPKLFQSAPETETSLPKPQGPEKDGSSPVSQPQDAVTKPAGESQDSREQKHPAEGPSGSQERYEDQETNSALAELDMRQPLSELDVDSLPGSASTSAQTDKSAVSKQLSSRAEPAGTSSQAEVQPAEARAQIDSQAESSQTARSPQLERDTAKENEEAGDEDAAQLRQRMQQLRQAMADKEAALEAAQGQPPQQLSKQQESDLVDKEAALVDALAAAQSQQQQQQESESDTSNATVDQQGQLREQQQQQQASELGPGTSARVVPRPSGSAEAATIFLERPGAAGELRSYPIEPDQLEESDDEEQGIDLVAFAAGAVLPHPDKVETGGEDAFFVSTHGQGAFGVADGVGGWNLEGVDPSRYSRLLMEHAEQAILEGKGDHEDGARDVVGLAHDSISWQGQKEGAVILGSSTICLGLVRPGGLLEMANVGDSGFRVIRGDETVFASESQQHSFNMPFQLACPGPDQYSDTCESATVYELELEPGDVVLLATDGVLDNMWDEQIAHVIHKCLGDGQHSVAKAQECARAVVEAAQENSFNPKFRSPWVVEAAKAGILPWWQRFKPEGGKVDDCTAVVICMEPASALQGSDARPTTAGSSAAVTAR